MHMLHGVFEMAASILVAYYSMSGNTRTIANEIGATTDADIEEIREPHTRHGLSGAIRALLDTLIRRTPSILPANRDPAGYDLLILGGPVWGGRMAAPVRTFAKRYGAKAPQVAFFCTEGGRGSDTAFAELEHLCMHAPRATLVVDSKHLEPSAHRAEIGHFASRMNLPVPTQPAKRIHP
jgi:flavodoxin